MPLFYTIFENRIIITFRSLAFEHERWFENNLSVNRSSWKISYRNNIFKNDSNNFQTFLIILNCSGVLKSVQWLFWVRSHVMRRPVVWRLMKISWPASAWCSFLWRDAFDQTFILVLVLMLLLSAIWTVLYVKWNFITF